MNADRLNEIREWAEQVGWPEEMVVEELFQAVRDLLAALSDAEQRAAQAEEERDRLREAGPKVVKAWDRAFFAARDLGARLEAAEARAAQLKAGIRSLHNEVDCRIAHGAESGGHLEYVRGVLADLAAEGKP